MDTPQNNTRVAIVTGAARGLGRSAALTLAGRGIIPIIVDINDIAAEDTVAAIRKIGVRSEYLHTDVSDIKQIRATVDAVADKFGSVDILVNNAGILSTSSIEELDEADWDLTMSINVKSAIFASQAALKYMKSAGWGRIINISSMAGRMGGISAGCAYSASKSAIIGLTMSIARQVAAEGITVNAIAPGPAKTEMVAGFTEEEFERLEKTFLMGRMVSPEAIGETIAFLASDGAEFITGAVIDVNGGMFMG